MVFRDTALGFIPKIGDGLAWITEKTTTWIAGLFNITTTAFQSRLISLIIICFILYLLISILSITKKLLKWGLIILFITLALSVLASIIG